MFAIIQCRIFVFQFTIDNLKIKMYRNIILPVALYGCETQLFTMGEESRLTVFEKRELRRIFGIKGGEVTGKWGRIYNEELNDLYSSPNIMWVIKSRRMRWMGHVACMGDRRSAYRVLVGIPEGRRLL
jgi:hypothetical protein